MEKHNNRSISVQKRKIDSVDTSINDNIENHTNKKRKVEFKKSNNTEDLNEITISKVAAALDSPATRKKKKVDYDEDFVFSKDKNGVRYGTCKKCQQKKVKKEYKMTDGNTSGLKSHLFSEHLEIYELLFGKSMTTPQRRINQKDAFQSSLESFIVSF